MKDWQRARRNLLKHLGVGAGCLPLLRAQRSWGQFAPRKRLILIEMIHGLRQTAWRPATGSLAGQTLPATSAAFEARKKDMIFLPNLTNPGIGTGGNGAYGVMFYGLGATGAGAYKEPTGRTLDQVVAAGLGRASGGRPSLNLSVQIDRAPRGTAAPGGNRCFWTGAGQPINPLGDPFAVYVETLAGSGPGADPAAARRLLARKKSILDSVGVSLSEFGSRLGPEDRFPIESHLAAIRDLEVRLSGGGPGSFCGTSPSKIDLTSDASYPILLKAQLQLMVDALKCGVTNVVTLQTSDAVGRNINFGAFVPGVPATGSDTGKSPYRTWEDLAETPVMNGTDHKSLVERWFFDRFAELLDQLAAIPEGAGTMLDGTVVVIGNDMQDGQNHDAQKVPWMLAGSANGALATGMCLASDGQRTASVMAAICEAMGVQHAYGGAMPGLRRT